jgi:hypothetical protein
MTVEPQQSSPGKSGRENGRNRLLNVLIGVLVAVVGFLLYSLVDRAIISRRVDASRAGEGAASVIQVDVLNGCGDGGMASRCTAYLRARGFDVVEMRNYKTFDLEKSFVIDRAGDRENAERVAYALGVEKYSVIQQINEDYYVDVSVVIGKDYRSLRPFE